MWSYCEHDIDARWYQPTWLCAGLWRPQEEGRGAGYTEGARATVGGEVDGAGGVSQRWYGGEVEAGCKYEEDNKQLGYTTTIGISRISIRH